MGIMSTYHNKETNVKMKYDRNSILSKIKCIHVKTDLYFSNVWILKLDQKHDFIFK